MIYTICNEKGGAGKSSIAQTLAVYLQMRNESVLLIDADPQMTTAEWAIERQESDRSNIPCVQLTGNLTASLQDIATKYENVVIDCGGADSLAMRSALTRADVALIPFRPKRRDLKVAPKMGHVIEQVQAINANLKVFSFVSQAPTLPNQAYRILGAKEVLSSCNLNPLEYITRNLNSWDDADEMGYSVLEWQDPKSKSDAINLFNELMEKIK